MTKGRMAVRLGKVLRNTGEESGIPDEDFINGKFDQKSEEKLTDILFILSTPRSGSTFLSDLMYKNRICVPHEYFQPFQYLALLAERWGCVDNGVLNKKSYIENLIKYRTSEKGWLGINLHGEHLNTFSEFEQYLPNVNKRYVHIVRRDEYSQAISYEIAYQTGKWSSHFDTLEKATYSFVGIKNKLDRIYEQNCLIKSYLNTREVSYRTVYYEDLVANARTILEDILPPDYHGSLNTESGLKKQSSAMNEAWLKQYSSEYDATNGKGYLKSNMRYILLVARIVARKMFTKNR